MLAASISRVGDHGSSSSRRRSRTDRERATRVGEARLERGLRVLPVRRSQSFLVHPDKAADFAEKLAFPACAFDEPFLQAVSDARRADGLERAVAEASQRADVLERVAAEASQRADGLERIASEASEKVDELERRVGELDEVAAGVSRLERENLELVDLVNDVATELSAMRATVSWRVTRPLRAVRGTRLRMGRPSPTEEGREQDDHATTEVGPSEERWSRKSRRPVGSREAAEGQSSLGPSARAGRTRRPVGRAGGTGLRQARVLPLRSKVVDG